MVRDFDKQPDCAKQQREGAQGENEIVGHTFLSCFAPDST
jgi:hypothetical protein